MIGWRCLVIFLIILFSISILTGQKLNQLSIVGKATRATGEIVPHDKLDANLNQAALVSFITDLEVDMDFKPWNGAVGMITNPAMGRWNVYVSPGERAIDVHAEGFKPLKVVLTSFGINSLKSGDVYYLEITGNIKLTLSSGKGNLKLITNPKGAEIKIDGFPNFKSLTPYEFKGYSARPYGISLSKERYTTLDTILTIIKDENVTHNIILKPIWGDLEIISNPSNLEVYINDSFEGNTPFELKGIEKGLIAGEYKAKVIPPNDFYPEDSRNILINSGKLTRECFDFYANSGEIQVNATPIPFTVYINGKIDSLLSSGVTKKFPQGTYKIEIEKEFGTPHYRSYEKILIDTFLIASNKISINKNLKKIMVNLSVSTNKQNVEFIVTDFETKEVVYNKKQEPNIEVLAGKYQIISKCNGFSDIIETYNLYPNIEVIFGSFPNNPPIIRGPLYVEVVEGSYLRNGKIEYEDVENDKVTVSLKGGLARTMNPPWYSVYGEKPGIYHTEITLKDSFSTVIDTLVVKVIKKKNKWWQLWK